MVERYKLFGGEAEAFSRLSVYSSQSLARLAQEQFGLLAMNREP
jgi:hypothetical protein